MSEDPKETQEQEKDPTDAAATEQGAESEADMPEPATAESAG